MIGIFDTGASGLLLAHSLAELLPGRQIVFYGDLSGTSLQSEPAAQVIARCTTGCDILVEKGCRLLVLACHRASALALDELRQQFRMPIIDVIGPTVAAALRAPGGRRFGLLADRTVIDSGVYQRSFQRAAPDCTVVSHSCPLLIPLVEEGWTQRKESKMIVKYYLRPLRDQQVDAVVPASSHLQQLLPLIATRVGRHTSTIDPFAAATEYLLAAAALLPPPVEETRPLPLLAIVNILSDRTERIVRQLGGRNIPIEKR